MGGHGGLNILPQKRWNVYNRDNRYKVAQDEAKAREENAAEKKARENRKRKSRRSLLVERAGVEVDNADGSDGDGVAANQQRRAFEKECVEARRRGKKSERTSDARFDEKFKFAYGLQDTKPWYLQPRELSTAGGSWQDKSNKATESNLSHSCKDTSLSRQKLENSLKAHTHNGKKRSSQRQKAKALLSGLSQSKDCPSVHELRKERLKRESIERRRALEMLQK